MAVSNCTSLVTTCTLCVQTASQVRVKKLADTASQVNSSGPRAGTDTGLVPAENYVCQLSKEPTTNPHLIRSPSSTVDLNTILGIF